MRRILAGLLLFCCLGASAPESVPEHSLVVVKLDTGERATVFSANFMPVEVFRGFDGLCFTGAPGRFAVLVVPSGDAPIQTLFVTIGKSPPVPPGPVPPDHPTPTGFAAEVKAKALAAGDREGARRAGAVFRAVLNDIGTKHTTVQQVYSATRDATKALGLPADKWNAFNAWLSSELTARAQTMDAVRTTYDAIATGLEGAGV